MATHQEDHFRRIAWTGERCVPWADDLQVIYEHYQRYLFIAPLASGRRVLDLASGEGYGASLLADEATSVIGLDIDEQAVLHAAESYQRPNLSFRRGDMLDLSDLGESSFDLVVCYEALEHVSDHERLLEGIARVLAGDGVFVVSTPDRLVYNEGQETGNPFHVHELSRKEFRALLGERFSHVRMWGQNVSVGALILPVEDDHVGNSQVISLTRKGGQWFAGANVNPTYLVAIASRAELPNLPAYSTLIDPNLELVREAKRQASDLIGEAAQREAELASLSNSFAEALGRLQQIEADNDRLRAGAATLRSHVQTTRAEGRRLAGELERAAGWVSQLEQERAAALLDLEALRSSSSYRLAQSLEETSERLLPHLRRRQLSELGRRARALFTRNGNPLPALPPGGASVASAEETAARAALEVALPYLPTSDVPRASIVIPVHGEWESTVRCLWSLAEDIPATPYEVILVDDASPDLTPYVLPRIGGARVLTLKKNQGFVRAVNAGAAKARGQYLVLLNNDTEVQAGWLDALLEAAESGGNIGIVGARLTYPDGMLQEAGGIIFGDGTGWNYGRGKDPGYPAYTFRRDVDYCSGACLLVRKDLWDQLGGFDTNFAPAYYEDADLAFSARKAGFRVVYEPRAIVAHHEGSSYGDDDSPKKRELLAANKKAFQKKWRAELKLRAKNDGRNVRTSSWRKPLGHTLVVDHMTPTFDQDAGSQRMFELLKILNDVGFAVTFVPHNGGNVPRYTQALEDLGIEVMHGPLDISDLIDQLAPDLRLVLLSRPKVAWGVVPLVRELVPEAKIIYDTVDLHFVRERRRAQLENDAEVARVAERYREMELWLARAADTTLVVSPIEQELLTAEAPDVSSHILPTIHRNQHPGRLFGDREGLLFVGSYNHPPNRDAVVWLMEEVLPAVRRELPKVPVSIVGSNPPPELEKLASDDVHILGWVPDLRSLYARSRVFLAPVRYGAGIRGKIAESLAHGLPVVSTTLGAEGLDLAPGRDLLVADGAADYAAAVVQLYRDERLWTDLATSGRRQVAVKYSPESVRVRVFELLVDLGLAERRSG